MITAGLVKELREKSGAGMMDCKKALTETNGDLEKAIEYLREKGILKAGKKSTRIAAEGLVSLYVSDDAKIGAIVEVNSETDFVAKNDKFVKFVDDLAKMIVEKDLETIEDLKAAEYEGKTVEEFLTELIATIGENMNIRRFKKLKTEGKIVPYLHGNGSIAVFVDLVKGSDDVATDVAMQITAMKPEFFNKEEVPTDRVEKEKEILSEQVKNEGKPAELAEKIALGKLGKFYEEICLLEQKFVKDSHISISEYLKQNNTEIKGFVRIEKGEGLEKKEENFAEEVAKQMNMNN